jgi:hypothetical protein
MEKTKPGFSKKPGFSMLAERAGFEYHLLNGGPNLQQKCPALCQSTPRHCAFQTLPDERAPFRLFLLHAQS